MSYQKAYRELKVGDIVETRREMHTNGGTIFAAGTRMRIFNKHGGLHLETINDKPYPHCGIGQKHSIRKISPFDVQKVTDDKN